MSLPILPAVFGIETEYAVPTDQETNGSLLSKGLGPAGLNLLGPGNSSGFLTNGARCYIDGHHPEYATPECLAPEDLVAAIEAGDRIIHKTFGEAYKTNLDYEAGTSWGMHESFLVHKAAHPAFAKRDNKKLNLLNLLGLHLVSRILYSGSGGFGAKRAGLRFVLSPRLACMQYFLSDGTQKDRGLINTRADMGDEKDGVRMHLICGDSVCSQLANYLRAGATALVIRCLEYGEGIDDVGCNFPPMTFATLVNYSPDRYKSHAVLIQRRLHDLVSANLSRDWMPPWAGAVLERWAAALDVLEEWDLEVMAGLFDWAMRKTLFEAYESDNPEFAKTNLWAQTVDVWPEDFDRYGLPLDSDARAKFPDHQRVVLEINTRFAKLGDGLFCELDGAGVLRHEVVPAAAVERAVTEPPRGRARARSILLRQGVAKAHWEVIVCRNSHLMLREAWRDPIEGVEEPFENRTNPLPGEEVYLRFSVCGSHSEGAKIVELRKVGSLDVVRRLDRNGLVELASGLVWPLTGLQPKNRRESPREAFVENFDVGDFVLYLDHSGQYAAGKVALAMSANEAGVPVVFLEQDSSRFYPVNKLQRLGAASGKASSGEMMACGAVAGKSSRLLGVVPGGVVVAVEGGGVLVVPAAPEPSPEREEPEVGTEMRLLEYRDNFVNGMRRFVGRQAKVTRVLGHDSMGFVVVAVDEDGGRFAWRASQCEMLPRAARAMARKEGEREEVPA